MCLRFVRQRLEREVARCECEICEIWPLLEFPDILRLGSWFMMVHVHLHDFSHSVGMAVMRFSRCASSSWANRWRIPWTVPGLHNSQLDSYDSYEEPVATLLVLTRYWRLNLKPLKKIKAWLDLTGFKRSYSITFTHKVGWNRLDVLAFLIRNLVTVRHCTVAMPT